MDAPFLKPLEELLARGVAASSEAGALCARLAGRRVRLDLEGLPGALDIRVDESGQLRLAFAAAEEPDCVIRALPLGLLRAGVTGRADALGAGGAEVRGDPVVAQDFQRLLSLARPDWEEELSRLVGDVAAHQLGTMARGLAGWSRKAADTLALDAGEFLTEESRQIPTRYEIEEVLDSVDSVRDDVDRLEARLDRLRESRRKSRS
jgi:ubiquinone biosynthesis protein UbiJ